MRKKCFTGETQRTISSTALATSSGRSCSFFHCPGFWISASTPPAAVALVVSVEVGDVVLGGADQVGAFLHLRVAAAEVGARDVEQPLLVAALGKTEDQHDHAQRKPGGDVVVEIAGRAARFHIVDGAAGQLGNPRLELLHLLGLEPGLGDLPVLLVLLTVHLRQAANEVGTAGHLVAHRLLEVGAEQLGARRVEEALGLALDLEHVGMLGGGPERTDPLRSGPVQRILGAQAREHRMLHRQVAIGLAAGDRLVDRGVAHRLSPKWRRAGSGATCALSLLSATIGGTRMAARF